MLGLACDGHVDLLESMIDAFTALIERHGYIPNGTRSYYLGRSQPPVFYLMVALSKTDDPVISRRRLEAMQQEHAFWMRGAEGLAAGEAQARCVRLPDGTILNRYWDSCDLPREEAWFEDTGTARCAHRAPSLVYRDLRAAAESGWDFSSRWLHDPNSLASICTTSIVPVDLNCLLYGLEQGVAALARVLGQDKTAAQFEAMARSRRCAVGAWLWSATELRYVDLDLETLRPTLSLNAASLFPLFAGLANNEQAIAMERVARLHLLAPGGLGTTKVHSGQQWDRPNGWAPLQWVAVAGFLRYGRKGIARTIAERWIATIERTFTTTGEIFEKYDVENERPGSGGEYVVQEGFGWTNGVIRVFDQYFPRSCQTKCTGW